MVDVALNVLFAVAFIGCLWLAFALWTRRIFRGPGQ